MTQRRKEGARSVTETEVLVNAATCSGIPDCIVQGDGPVLKLRTPSQRGAYRVFCIVRDGHGGASADNFPFYVK